MLPNRPVKEMITIAQPIIRSEVESIFLRQSIDLLLQMYIELNRFASNFIHNN